MKNSYLQLFLLIGLSINCISGVCGRSQMLDYAQSYTAIYHSGNTHDTIQVYCSKAENGAQREWGSQQGKRFNVAIVPFNPNCTIEIIKTKSHAIYSSVYPRSYRIGKIKLIHENGSAKLTLRPRAAQKLVICFDDDPENRDLLTVFVTNVNNYAPPIDDSTFHVTDSSSLSNITSKYNSVHFDKGTFRIGRWSIPKYIKNVWLAPGSVIKGFLRGERSIDDPALRIYGPGIITNVGYAYHYPSTKDINEYEPNTNWYKSIEIFGGQGHSIEDVTIVDPTSYAVLLKANRSTIKNVIIHGFRMNNDAITIVGDENTVDDCFIRVNDDAIVPYGNKLTFKNLIFWQLPSGSVFQLGWTPHSMKDIVIKNCDVIAAEWKLRAGNIGFVNAMLMRNSAEPSIIEGLDVSDIRFDTPVTRFVDIQPNRNVKRNEPDLGVSQPWIFKNCSFKRIFLREATHEMPLVIFHGYSEEHASQNIIFQDIYIESKKASLRDQRLKSMIDIKTISKFQFE